MSKVAPLVHVTWVAMFCTLPQSGFFLQGQPVSRWDQVLFVVNGGAVPCCFARKLHTIRQPNLGADSVQVCGRVRGKFCQHLKTFARQAGNQNKMQPTNPNAHTYVNGTDVKTDGYAITQNTFLQ